MRRDQWIELNLVQPVTLTKREVWPRGSVAEPEAAPLPDSTLASPQGVSKGWKRQPWAIYCLKRDLNPSSSRQQATPTRGVMGGAPQGFSPFASAAADPLQHQSPAAAEIELQQTHPQVTTPPPELNPQCETSALHTSALHAGDGGLLNRDGPTDSRENASVLVRLRSGGDAGPSSSVDPNAVSRCYSDIWGGEWTDSRALPTDFLHTNRLLT